MGGNRNAIAYGILKSVKVNTKGMSPKQAWQKVKELGLLGKAKSYGYNDDELDDLFDEINNFHPTPEMERVIEKAKGVAKKVTVTTNAHENFEKAIDHLIALKERYGFEMLDEIKTADFSRDNPARASAKTLTLSNQFLENPKMVLDIDTENLHSINFNYITAQEAYDAVKFDRRSSSAVIEKALDLYVEKAKRNAFGRLHVGIVDGVSADEIINIVITHEIGHVIAGRLSPQKQKHIDAKFEDFKYQYNQINEPDAEVLLHHLSLRALDSSSEFVAELFTSFHYSEPLVKEVIRGLIGRDENKDEFTRFLQWFRA